MLLVVMAPPWALVKRVDLSSPLSSRAWVFLISPGYHRSLLPLPTNIFSYFFLFSTLSVCALFRTSSSGQLRCLGVSESSWWERWAGRQERAWGGTARELWSQSLLTSRSTVKVRETESWARSPGMMIMSLDNICFTWRGSEGELIWGEEPDTYLKWIWCIPCKWSFIGSINVYSQCKYRHSVLN